MKLKLKGYPFSISLSDRNVTESGEKYYYKAYIGIGALNTMIV